MAYKREIEARTVLTGDALTAALVGIGMLFSAAAEPDPNIEDTLLAASAEGMERNDLRVLAVLVTWLEVHHPWLNADRLTRLIEACPGERIRAFWCAIARHLDKDRRLARLTRVYLGPRLDLLGSGTEFHISRSGEDPRFQGGPLRVPAGILRDRPGDVLSPAELARNHRGYRRRVLLGPSYRADVWAELDRNPGSTPAELARRAYASFATAWQVKRDWSLLGMGAAGPGPPPPEAARTAAAAAGGPAGAGNAGPAPRPPGKRRVNRALRTTSATCTGRDWARNANSAANRKPDPASTTPRRVTRSVGGAEALLPRVQVPAGPGGGWEDPMAAGFPWIPWRRSSKERPHRRG